MLKIENMGQDRSNAWVPAAQWCAVLSMTFEHVTRFVFPESSLLPPALLIGRIAFPIFAGMVAWHLLYNTRQPMRYGLRLLLVGAVSQIPYAWVVTPDRFNVCFTLSLGLFSVLLLAWINQRFRLIVAAFLVCIGAAASPIIEYQIFGLLLVPAFVYAFRHQTIVSMMPALAVCIGINGGLPFHMAISGLAGLIVLRAPYLSMKGFTIPALPRFLRMSWYPLHLFAIAGILIAGSQWTS